MSAATMEACRERAELIPFRIGSWRHITFVMKVCTFFTLSKQFVPANTLNGLLRMFRRLRGRSDIPHESGLHRGRHGRGQPFVWFPNKYFCLGQTMKSAKTRALGKRCGTKKQFSEQTQCMGDLFSRQSASVVEPFRFRPKRSGGLHLCVSW